MIRSFRSRETQAVFEGWSPRPFRNIAAVAERKLNMLHGADRLSDLMLFPGNRLERLKGDRAGQYSIRINDQYRICFTWQDGHAYDVDIVDYH